MKTYPSAQTLGFFDVELRLQWLEAKGNPLSRLEPRVRKTQTEGAAMKPATPKTELPPSTQLRKVVFGGSQKLSRVALMGILLLTAGRTFADLSVPAMFSDHIVLQRGILIPIWGTASPGGEVTVSVGQSRIQTKAAADG